MSRRCARLCWKSRSTTRCLADGIEIARRFVGQQQRRLGQHGAADGHALLFALRKAVREIAEPVSDAGVARQLLRRGPRSPASIAARDSAGKEEEYSQKHRDSRPVRSSERPVRFARRGRRGGRRRPARSSPGPARESVPREGDRIPEIKFNRVVLPEPLGPTMATRSPTAIFSDGTASRKSLCGKLKFEIGNGNHSSRTVTALFTWLCRVTVMAVIFHEPPAGSISNSAAYSLTRVWMWPQCSTVPSTCQVRRSAKPFLLFALRRPRSG